MFRPGRESGFRSKARASIPDSSSRAYELFIDGYAHHRAGRLNEAERLFRQALAADPRHPDSLHALGVIAHQVGRHDAAADLIGKAVAISPRASVYHLNLGNALKGMGKIDEAGDCYRKALDLKPDYGEAYSKLGDTLWYQGRFEEAAAAYETALRLGADPAAAYSGLSQCRKFTQADRPLIADMEALVEKPNLPDASRSALHFALGKIFDDLAEHGTAIRHVDEANRLESKRHKFDRAQFAAFIDRSIEVFSREALKAPHASESELPVLIVGMPRSGTTLTEQILASHPKVATGGELDFWLSRLAALGNRAVGLLDPATEQNLIRDYLGRLKDISPDATRVTDKMPYNFLVLGLVHRLFPKARIIHCRRNPLDTALSIYFARFTRVNDFSYSRGDIVAYYREYLRQMAHWRAVLPADRLIEVDYEELIADPEATSRRLVAFCGLEWDEACRESHKTDRPIRTASAWQARQPIYATSAERWRRYEPWLGELRQLLPRDGTVPG